MNELSLSKGKNVISGILLVIGTSIGAGMLGMPVENSQMGFKASICAYTICWLIITMSALIFLEVQARIKEKVNISSMSILTFGKKSTLIVEALFFLLYYSLLIAYFKGFMQLISSLFPNFGFASNALLTLLFFVPCVFYKETGIKNINAFLVFGLAISYLFIVLLGIGHIDSHLLSHCNWNGIYFSFPFVITAFGFHVIIPSLYYYQGKNIKTTRLSIICGTVITLIIYISWQAIVSGIIPLEDLQEAHKSDQTAIIPLQKVLQYSLLPLIGKFFAFFALTSSCLGVSIAFYDFVVDRLKIRETNYKKAALLSLIFIPPILIVKLNIPIFYYALRYGGGIGVLSLLILLPALMDIMQKRNNPNIKGYFWEKIAIACIFIFSLLTLAGNISSF